jgi:hypothetical protein
MAPQTHHAPAAHKQAQVNTQIEINEIQSSLPVTTQPYTSTQAQALSHNVVNTTQSETILKSKID